MGDLSDLTPRTDMIRVLVCFVVLASLSLTSAEESKQDLVERSDAEIELVRGVREAGGGRGSKNGKNMGRKPKTKKMNRNKGKGGKRIGKVGKGRRNGKKWRKRSRKAQKGKGKKKNKKSNGRKNGIVKKVQGGK